MEKQTMMMIRLMLMQNAQVFKGDREIFGLHLPTRRAMIMPPSYIK